MYCIQCGVKLADSEKQCPLCGTRVFHPDFDMPDGHPPYPKGKQPSTAPRSFLWHIILTALYLIPILVVPLCDIQLNGSITWSGYVTGALLLGYEMFVLPLWFRKPNPVIFVPCSFAAIGVYLFYVNLATGGNWFMTFAFPLTGGICLIVTAVVTLLRYVPKGALYTLGGASIAMGGLMLLMEFLVNITFSIPKFFGWSLYPLIALVILGGLLIFLAICRPARQTLERKFFI
jgi:hypothetical protein